MTIYDGEMKPYSVKVSGVFNIYAGREMLMSKKAFASVFGYVPEKNSFLVNCNGAYSEELIGEIKTVKGVGEITDSIQLHETFLSYAAMLDLIAVILTVIAGLMAYFILLNLVNMYFNQKKKELTHLLDVHIFL